MRILVFSWRDPKHPLAGGAEQVMHEHMKGWVKAGHEVTLFTSHFKDALRTEVLDGVQVVRRGYQLLGVHIIGFFWYVFGKHPKFDLVVDQFHGISFLTPLYVRAKKLAVIQEVAKEVWFMNHLPWPFNWLVGVIGYITEPIIFVLYKNVPFMTGSDSAKKDVVKFGVPARNINVVLHGVIVEKPDPFPKKEKKPTVVFLGTLARDKGIEDAIKAFYLMGLQSKTKRKGWQFWVVGKGSGDYFLSLQKMCRDLGIARQVKFWGFVSQQEKFRLLARAHLLINPSVREGWGLVNIEANAVGTPIVAYRSPGLVDSVRDGVSGILCKTNTPQALAENVISLLNDKKTYERLRKSAVLWCSRFNWENSRRISLNLIQKICDIKK